MYISFIFYFIHLLLFYIKNIYFNDGKITSRNILKNCIYSKECSNAWLYEIKFMIIKFKKINMAIIGTYYLLLSHYLDYKL